MTNSHNKEAISMIGNIFSELLVVAIPDPLIFEGYEDTDSDDPYNAVVKFVNSNHELKIHFSTKDSKNLNILGASLKDLTNSDKSDVYVDNNDNMDPMMFIHKKIAPALNKNGPLSESKDRT